MKTFLKKLWARFKSAVPPIVKKLQLILGLASASFTGAAAISWPQTLLFVANWCTYAAAISAFTIILLQFTQQLANLPDTRAEVNSSQLPINTTLTTK